MADLRPSPAVVGHNAEETDRFVMDIEDQKRVPGDQGSTLLKDAKAEIRSGFVRKVYSILAVQLLVTVLVAAPFQTMSPEFLQKQSWLLGLSCIMTLVMVCVMTCNKELTRTYPTNYALLFGFTLFEAILVGFAASAYTWQSVLLCVGVTAIVFVGLTIFAHNTKTDFTGFGLYLYGFLLSFMAFGFMLCFLSMLGVPIQWGLMIYDLAGVLLFVGYIIYDTQLILGGTHKAHEFSIDDYVFAALNLYLDIIQLFLHLLRLMGQKKQ